MAQVKVHGITKEYSEGTVWMEVVREHQKEYEYNTLLARVDGKLQELHKQVKDCELSFVAAEDKSGASTYQRSASLTMLKIFYSMAGPGNVERLMIDFSIGRGFFVEARGNSVLGQEFLDAVKTKMGEYMEWEIPITRRSMPTDDTIEFSEKLGMYDKIGPFRYRTVSKVNIYSIDGFEDYCYGYTVQSTGYIKHFDLALYHYEFVMVTPDRNTPGILHKFAPSDRLSVTLSESAEWGRRMDLETVGALNDRITKDDMSHLVLIQEALQEKRIAEIAAQVAARESARPIVIAGPSPSSKTIFSHRLPVQLEAINLKPHSITVNNYFVSRVDSPRDEHGNYNYEILECLDVELFSRDMTGLLEGERMELPHYNFKKEVREYKGSFL